MNEKNLKAALVVAGAIFAANYLFNQTELDEEWGAKLPGFDPASGNGALALRMTGTAAAVVAALVLTKTAPK